MKSSLVVFSGFCHLSVFFHSHWCFHEYSAVHISLTQHAICTLSDSAWIRPLIPLKTWCLPSGSFVSLPGLFLILIFILLPCGSDLASGLVCSLVRWAIKAIEEKWPAWGPLSLGQQWGQSPVSFTAFHAPHPAHSLQWVSVEDQTQPVPSSLKTSLMFFGKIP